MNRSRLDYVTVMLIVIILQSSVIAGLLIRGPKPSLMVTQSQFDECIKGWHKSIDDLNSFTAKLNAMTGRR